MERVVSHLTLAERRLREAERRAAEGARREAKGQEAAVEEASAKGARMIDAGHHQKRARGSVGDVAFVRHKAAGCWAAQRRSSCSSSRVGGNEEERRDIQVPPSPSSDTDNRKQNRSALNGKRRTSHHDASGFADESQQQLGDTVALQENRDPAGNLTVASGFAASYNNEDAANILREVEAVRRQVADAEQQAAALRVDANRVRAEAAKTAAENEIGKERAMMESERLARELKATGIEVCHVYRGWR